MRPSVSIGAVATHTSTDNGVTTGHIAGIPVRHPAMAAAGRHYGITIATCVPADPYIAALGERRVVTRSSVISLGTRATRSHIS